MTAPARLPAYDRFFGPVTGRRIARLLGLYVVVAVIGMALAGLSSDAGWQAAGLGLILPGGGFLAHYDFHTAAGLWHIAGFLAAAGLFGVALVIWFATGNILAPPAAWLGCAVAAGLMRHGPVQGHAVVSVIALAAALFMGLVVVALARFVLAQKQRAADNLWLATADFPSRDDDDPYPEMTAEDLQHLRFALDRALQPVEAFDGFEHLDPFQTAALRYQVNFLAYGLALNQARFTPACRGYLHDAQVRMIDKQAQTRVWSYWRLENLWGNLSLDRNPVARENIMYTGFVALQMALLRVTTDDEQFEQPGRLQLDDELRFCDGDFVAQLQREQQRSAFGLVACEPNWIYPLCNTIGMSAIRYFDSVWWEDVRPRFMAALDGEFLDAFGRSVPCRSARTGMALPAIGGAMPLAMPCFFLNALAPEIACRQWLLLRRRLFDGGGRFRRDAFWPIDTGNYGLSRASAYSAAMLAAAELGDREVYDQYLAALDAECPAQSVGGVIHRPMASVWAHGVELMARATVKDGFRHLMSGSASSRPYLDDLPYPDVLVASAHVEAGGLRAVLCGDGVHDIVVKCLDPLRTYHLHGATGGSVTTDEQGEIRFSVRLNGRTLLTVKP